MTMLVLASLSPGSLANRSRHGGAWFSPPCPGQLFFLKGFPMKEQLLQIFVDSVLPVIGLVISMLVGALVNSLRKRVRNETAAAILTRLQVTAGQVVSALAQRSYERIRSAAADGEITATELAEIKALAVSDVKEYLGKSGLKDLANIVDSSMLEKVLLQAVEKALRDSQK